MTIGEKIKNLRKEKGLTQKNLGVLCGMTAEQIRQYELGIRIPKIVSLKKIADSLNVLFCDLLPLSMEISCRRYECKI